MVLTWCNFSPYTQGLMACIPVRGKTVPGQPLQAIPGVVPSLIGQQQGCAFRNRCPHCQPRCHQDPLLIAQTAQHQMRCVRAQTWEDVA